MGEFINPADVPKVKFYTGDEAPCIGMGTFGSDRFTADQIAEAVDGAIKIGYRMFDCAACYGNEPEIGKVFKNAFDEEERAAGLVNYILGFTHITEGAIPFAASDPLRVLPSCIIGSAVAGGISMAFKCTLMAPHGGIFVFPVVGHAWMYFVALVIGTVISALLLGILKKKVA